MEQKLILHHVDDDGAVASCGSTIWAHASKGWTGVDCPGCLSAQMHPTGLCSICGEPDSGLESVPAVEFDTQPRG